MKNILGGLVIGLSVLAIGWAWAGEEDELRDRAERDRLEAKEAEVLEAKRRERVERSGQVERERDALHRELQTVLEKRETLVKRLGEDHPEVRDISRHVDELQRELEARSNRRERHHREKEEREHIAQKIEHLHAAAGHLDEAGVPDMAREIRNGAKAMERELHRRYPEHNEGRHLDELREQMQDMRREIEKLRDEVTELREQLEKV